MLELIVSFVSGGLVVAVIEWYRGYQLSRLERRLQLTRDSLSKLYGPIYFYTVQNQECFRICRELHKALHSDKINITDENGKYQLLLTKEELDCAINLTNEYVEIVKKNNDQIFEIAQNNWVFIEFDDIDLFRKMIVDYTRLKIEYEESGKLKTPLMIYTEIGDVCFMQPEYVERIEQRVREKQSFLENKAGVKRKRTSEL